MGYVHDVREEAAQDPSRVARGMLARTLIFSRWLAVLGQTATIFLVEFGLQYPLPIVSCLMVIAAASGLNFLAALKSPAYLGPWAVTAWLAVDTIEVTVLLALTGGLINPFAVFLLGPITVASSALPGRCAVVVGAAGAVATSFLALGPVLALPGPVDAPGTPPTAVMEFGKWLSMVIAVMFIGLYVRRVARERDRMEAALAATQDALSREQKFAALGGLAAAAAHELGTPLATIQTAAKEMQRIASTSEEVEDAKVIVEQTMRCREILGRLSSHGDAGDAVHDMLPLGALLEEATEPFAGAAVAIEVALAAPVGADHEPPMLRRQAEMLYALKNLVENAVDFAHSQVAVSASWDDRRIVVQVRDDGPGFAPEILSKLGEPYFTRRSARAEQPTGGGLGLGVFIAKTLIERCGGRVYFRRDARAPDGLGGALVEAVWLRRRVEKTATLTNPAVAAE